MNLHTTPQGTPKVPVESASLAVKYHPGAPNIGIPPTENFGTSSNHGLKSADMGWDMVSSQEGTSYQGSI